MVEKISELNQHLPEFLVETKSIYGILSKGIHELSEAECLEYFNVMKVGIELILDEKIKEKERKEKQETIRKSINQIQSKINDT